MANSLRVDRSTKVGTDISMCLTISEGVPGGVSLKSTKQSTKPNLNYKLRVILMAVLNRPCWKKAQWFVTMVKRHLQWQNKSNESAMICLTIKGLNLMVTSHRAVRMIPSHAIWKCCFPCYWMALMSIIKIAMFLSKPFLSWHFSIKEKRSSGLSVLVFKYKKQEHGQFPLHTENQYQLQTCYCGKSAYKALRK